MPAWLRMLAAYSWRLLVVAVAVVAVARAAAALRLVVLPVLLALFAAALLQPPYRRLRALRWPPALAAASVLLAAIAAVATLALLIVPPFVDQLDALGSDLRAGVEELGDWLVDGPINLTQGELDRFIDDAIEGARSNASTFASGAVSGALVAVEVLAGLLLAVVLTFFFLKDGDRLWDGVVSLFSPARQRDLRAIGERVWPTLRRYIGGVTVVAAFDAVFIGLALLLLDVPAALPLAVFVFFGAFVPIVGAVATGAAAVLVALVAQGPVAALAVLGAVIAVQQLEGNVLQPVVVGRAVAVHPVAILLAVTAGAVLWGVIGALIAVPLTAVGARIGGYLRERQRVGGADRAPS